MTFWATVGAVMVGYVLSVIFYLTIAEVLRTIIHVKGNE